MKSGVVRPIAICVFWSEDRLFLAEGYDSVKKETFYRPLGGTIEFGERGGECVSRELREEIGAEIKDLRYLNMIENIFTHNGQPGHEIVLVYEANLVDARLYEVESVRCKENGGEFKAVWKPLADFRAKKAPLYPEGLLNLLNRKLKEHSDFG